MSNNEIREKRKKVICDLVKDDFYVPMKEKELAMFLQVAKEDREEFREILRELLAEGKLTLTVKGKYMKSNGKVLTGTFISNAKGFGFVEVEGRDEDLFIPEDKQGGAFHKDTVEVALLPAKTGKRQEAQVLRIIARGMTQVVGTYEQSKSNFGFVIPDNTKIAQDIFVPKEWSKGAMTGHKVVVEITGYGTNTKSPEGKVVEILGHINDPGVDIMSIVRGFDLPVEFGEKIMNQVERVSQTVSEADCAGRRDLRDVTMVTIDGEDAKDLDDAVSVSFDGTYYHLGVHIADVTNYVQENSALDREALKRGTSVYLVDRVIPMLPHALSNGICSLNKGVDRLALSCLMKVDEEGEIVDYEICESVIRVNKRMSYTVVKKLLEEPECVEHNAGMPDETAALDDVSFSIEKGDFVGVMGSTGSGKSTLIAHFNGLNRPTSGKIIIDGRDMWAEGENLRDFRFLVGLVMQYPEYQLFEETCWKDIAYGPRNMGLDEEEITRRVKRAAEFVGLDEALLQKSPFELSGGQKRRVAIAGVMAMEPKILVLDEPAAGLDPEGRDTILSQIRNYHEQTGITVILVSHSMEDIARYANRVLVMSKAKVAMYDTVEKVFARAPELLELGLSVPQVTQVFLMLKAMGMEIDTDVYTVPYAVKTVLKAWNAKHPDKAVPLPQNHKTVQEGGAD